MPRFDKHKQTCSEEADQFEITCYNIVKIVLRSLNFRQMDNPPRLYHSNGMFLIFDRECAMKVRRHRVVGQLLGCCPKKSHQIATSDLPYHISDYAACILFENKLALFNKMIQKQEIVVERNEYLHSEQLTKLKEEATKAFVKQRTAELEKRGIRTTVERIGQLDESKMKMTVPFEPMPGYSNFEVVRMSDPEVAQVLKVDDDKMTVYRDLYKRGFYLSSGMKFGSDFLAYLGEPVRYHARYAVRVIRGPEESIDFNCMDFNEMNALNRLCCTANKVPLLAVVYQVPGACNKQTKYWSLHQKEYIEPDAAKLYPV